MSTSPVTRYVDAFRALHGADPPKQTRVRIGVESKKLGEEGIAREHILRGVEILAERGMDPGMLHSAVTSAMAEMGPHGRDQRLLREFLELHGGRWPTGAYFVRGSHSGAAVYDPLGYDPRPHDFPFPKPNREEVLSALRDLDDRAGT